MDVFERLVAGAFEVILTECQTSALWPSLTAVNRGKLSSLLLPSSSSSSTEKLVELLYSLAVHICRSVVKPRQLQRLLAEAGLEPPRCTAFVATWKENAAALVEAIQETTSLSKCDDNLLLTDVTWKLQLLTESSYEAERKLPLGQLDFLLQEKERLPSTTQDEDHQNEQKKKKQEETTDSEHLSVNFSHSELASFYSSLEAVQAKIDQLIHQPSS